MRMREDPSRSQTVSGAAEAGFARGVVRPSGPVGFRGGYRSATACCRSGCRSSRPCGIHRPASRPRSENRRPRRQGTSPVCEADHAGDVQTREDDDRGHRKADAERPSLDMAHPPHRDEQHGCDRDDRDDARHLPEQRCAEIVNTAAPGGVLRPRKSIDHPDPERDRGNRAVEQPVGAGYPGKPPFVRAGLTLS